MGAALVVPASSCVVRALPAVPERVEMYKRRRGRGSGGEMLGGESVMLRW